MVWLSSGKQAANPSKDRGARNAYPLLGGTQRSAGLATVEEANDRATRAVPPLDIQLKNMRVATQLSPMSFTGLHT